MKNFLAIFLLIPSLLFSTGWNMENLIGTLESCANDKKDTFLSVSEKLKSYRTIFSIHTKTMEITTETTPEIHENILAAWRAHEQKILYRTVKFRSQEIVVNSDGKVTVINDLMESTYDPHGSEESLCKFLSMYVR